MNTHAHNPRSFAALCAAACISFALPQAHGAPLADETTVREAAYRVEQMACTACADRIQTGLAKRPEISELRVVFRDKLAVVRFDPARATPESIRTAIDDLGYSATLLPFHFRVTDARLEVTPGATVMVDLVLAIGPDDAYVHPDAPLKLKIAGENVTLSKATLSRADARQKRTQKAKLLTFPVTLSVATAGERTVKADLSFFYCTPQSCTRKTASAHIAVEAKQPTGVAAAP